MSAENEKDKLTEQHREFCRLVVSGISQRKAYAQAFGCQLESAGQSATKLMKRAYIQEELGRLREKSQECERKRDERAIKRAIWTKHERMVKIQEWAEESAAAGKIAEALRCVQELNQMEGAYEQEVVNLSDVLGVGAVVAALQAQGSLPPVH